MMIRLQYLSLHRRNKMTIDFVDTTIPLSETEPRFLEKKDVYRLEDLGNIEGVLDQARTC